MMGQHWGQPDAANELLCLGIGHSIYRANLLTMKSSSTASKLIVSLTLALSLSGAPLLLAQAGGGGAEGAAGASGAGADAPGGLTAGIIAAGRAALAVAGSMSTNESTTTDQIAKDIAKIQTELKGKSAQEIADVVRGNVAKNPGNAAYYALIVAAAFPQDAAIITYAAVQAAPGSAATIVAAVVELAPNDAPQISQAAVSALPADSRSGAVSGIAVAATNGLKAARNDGTISPDQAGLFPAPPPTPRTMP